MITECACVVDKRFVWYFTYEYNSLNWFDLESKKGDTVGFVPWENKFSKRLYCDIFQYKNRLVLIPYRCHNIAIYDIERRKFSKNNTFISASCSCFDEEYIYILGQNDKKEEVLLKYYIEDDKIEVLFDFSQIKNAYLINEIWSSRMEKVNQYIVFCCGFTNLYIRYSLINNELKINKIPGDITRSYGMASMGDLLLALDFDTSYIVLFSWEGEIIDEKYLGSFFSNELSKFFYIVCIKDRVIVDFHIISMVFEIYYDNEMIVTKKKVDPIGGRCGKIVLLDENQYILLPTSERKSFITEKDEIEIEKIPIRIDMILPYILHEQCYIESDDISVEDYIKCIL